MSALAALTLIDMSPDLAALARRYARAGADPLAPREREEYVTLHYSAVAYADRSRTAELQHIRDETRFHIEKDWGCAGNPAYSTRYMYDVVVLSDGGIVRTDGQRLQRWHCGNARGNRSSWSVHVLLGAAQDLTMLQRSALFALFDALCIDSAVPRFNVVAHCEWPCRDGYPVRGADYTRQAGQSSCPGPVLHHHVAAYRAIGPAPTFTAPRGVRYVVRGAWGDVHIDYAQVRQDRSSSAKEASFANGHSIRLAPGTMITIDDVRSGWAHLADGAGFVATWLLQEVTS